MDPLHRQVILDCFEDICRDMNPVLVIRYSPIKWQDGDQDFIRAKAKTEGRHYGATVLLNKLLDFPHYDGFDDFILSLEGVPYNHLVKQLQANRRRLQREVREGKIRRKELGRRRQDTKRTPSKIALSVAVILASLLICAWILTVHYSYGTNETHLLATFPRRLRTFVGREDIFPKIDACLEQEQKCLIKGLGGVGKTTLAIEYGHRRADRYPGGVFWVRLASKGDLCASISLYSWQIRGGRDEAMHSNEELGCRFMTVNVRRYLTNSKHWLLVADEAITETVGELDALLPYNITETMHVLLTSREYQKLDMERIVAVNLPPFSNSEAYAFFNRTFKSSDKDDRKAIKRLSQSLGHHPLALQFAFSYMVATGCSVREYSDKYICGNEAQRMKLLNKANIEESTSKRIRQTLDPHFHLLDQQYPNAAILLNLTSFMGPDCIPCPEPDNQRFSSLFHTSEQFDKLDILEMVALLERFSLASRCLAFHPKCAFSVNRIVQEVIVAEMDESLRLAHLENALKYSKLLLSHDNDFSRVQAEFLMAQVHYVSRNVDRYQTKVSFNSSSVFLRKSAEFFCKWGSCEDAYFHLLVQVLLFFGHNSTQNLPCRLLGHANFLNRTLLPCLYNSNTSVDLLINIADNLFWESIELDHRHSRLGVPDTCDINQVKTLLKKISSAIYMRLLQSRKLENVDYNILPDSFFRNVLIYIAETPFDQLDKLFMPNPSPNTSPETYWNGLHKLVYNAGRILQFHYQHFLRFADREHLKKVLSDMNKCDPTKCNQFEQSRDCCFVKGRLHYHQCNKTDYSDKAQDYDSQMCYHMKKLELLLFNNQCNEMECPYETQLKDTWLCCHQIKDLTIFSHYLRNDLHIVMKVVHKVLLMYYSSMITSTCTNRYFEVMLGLPRESEEFDILKFARDDWHYLLGNPGVVKSVLSLTENPSPKFQNGDRYLNPGSISPLSYFKFYRELMLRYQLNYLLRLPQVENCNVISDVIAGTWKQLDSKWFRKYVKILLHCCNGAQSIRKENMLEEVYSRRLETLNAVISHADTLLDFVQASDPISPFQFVKNITKLFEIEEHIYHLTLEDCIRNHNEVDAISEMLHMFYTFFRDCFSSDRTMSSLLCRRDLDILSSKLGKLRREQSNDLIRLKRRRDAEKKQLRRICSIKRFPSDFRDIWQDTGGNPFVEEYCSEYARPSLRAVFSCDSVFPFVLWFWNRLLEAANHANCALDHAGLHISCLNNFIETVDKLRGKICEPIYSNTDKSKGTFFGKSFSDDEGDNFHFVQSEDLEIVGVFHKVWTGSLSTTGLPVTREDIRICKKLKQKRQP